MAEHVKVLAVLGIARALAALLVGGLLISKAGGLSLADYGSSRGALEMGSIDAGDREDLGFDQRAFAALGALCVAFAVIRTVQGIGVLRTVRWARPLGLGLAVFDALNLALFPLSTALGLYGLVVYRHPEAVARFGARRR